MARVETRPEKRQYQGSFTTKPLPKQEYHLFRALQDEYELPDASVFITILVRVFYEMHHLKGPIDGQAMLRTIIETWRMNPEEQRTYMLK